MSDHPSFSPPENAAELRELFSAICEGSASPDQCRAFREALEADVEAIDYYVRYVQIEELLRRTFAAPQLSGGRDNLDAFDDEKTFELIGSDGASIQSDSRPAITTAFPVLQTTFGYLSTGWPLAYLIAAVIFGIGAVIGTFTYVSQPTDIAQHSSKSNPQSLSPNPSPKPTLVARITGMVDCKWSDPKTVPVSSHVCLGHTYALASGLMEITYNSGAKVLLQGPCTYEVDSAAGGYLEIGKLTARVEKRGERRGEREGPRPKVQGSRQENLQASKSPNSNPQSLIPNPLFVVRTPTATVTDLGTEFGVEVGPDRENRVHVFSGRVEFRGIGETNRKSAPIVLSQGESIVVGPNGPSSESATAKPADIAAHFIRNLPRAKSYIDLLDLIAGGDGSQSHRMMGVDPTCGAIEAAHVSKMRTGGDRYSSVADNPWIDGVFVPNGGGRAVQLDSAGHSFNDFPKTDGTTLGSIWARDAKGFFDGQAQRRRDWFCAIGPASTYMTSRLGLLCLHPNAGITFDLEKIRQTRHDGSPVRFSARAGMAGPGMADLWVFVDGQLKFQRMQLCKQDGAVDVGLIVAPNDRFLTLVSTDGGNGVDYDWLFLGDPVLQIAPHTETDKSVP